MIIAAALSGENEQVEEVFREWISQNPRLFAVSWAGRFID